MDFKNTLSSYAITQGRSYDILPGFIMAVAMLETGFGSSQLCKEANNLFSIKGSYNGHSTIMPTSEYVDNKWIKVNAAFRKYPSYGESVHDFCELMKNGISWNRSVYSKAVIGVYDLEKVCINFGKTPYMTDPAYSAKLLSICRSEDLEAYSTAPAPPKEETFSHHYTSLVDFLKAHGKDSSFPGRAILARQHGIKNYNGAAEQNTHLLKILGGQ